MVLDIIHKVKGLTPDVILRRISELAAIEDDNTFCQALAANDFKDDDATVDMLDWQLIVERINAIFARTSKTIPTTFDEPQESKHAPGDDLRNTKLCLAFCAGLLANAHAKRLFWQFDYLYHFLGAYDSDVVELTLDVLFAYSVSMNGVVSGIDDMHDEVEIETRIAELCARMFEGFRLFDAGLAMSKYIAQENQGSVLGNEVSIEFTLADGCSTKQLVLHRREQQTIQESLLALIQEGDIPSSHYISLACALRALHATSWLERRTVVRVQLLCLFMLVHSKFGNDRLVHILGRETDFWKDIIALADPTTAVLHCDVPFSISSIALDCLTAFIARRRDLLAQLGVEKHLGLIEGNQQGLLLSTITYSVSVATGAISQPPRTFVAELSHTHKLSLAGLLGENTSHVDLDISKHWLQESHRFIRLTLELLSAAMHSTALQTNDEQVWLRAAEGVIVPLVVDIARGCIPPEGISNTMPTAPLWTAGHALQIAETLLYKNIRQQFVQVGGVNVLGDVIHLFGQIGNGDPALQLAMQAPSVRCVVESGLGTLLALMTSSNRWTTVANMDTGVQQMYQPDFHSLVSHIFAHPAAMGELVWITIVRVLRAAIDLDPAMVTHFVETGVADAFATSIQQGAMLQTTGCVSDSVLHLIHAFCLTQSGKDAMLGKGLIQHFIGSLVHPAHLLPNTVAPIQVTVPQRMGRAMYGVASELPEIMDELAHATQGVLRTCVLSLNSCSNAEDTDDFTMANPRMLGLQQFTNLCLFLEGMATRRDRNNAQLLNAILDAEMLKLLVGCYSHTFAPGSQLLCQMTAQSNVQITHYGYFPAAKYLTSVLRIIAQSTPDKLIGILFQELDHRLFDISEAKSELKLDHTVAESSVPEIDTKRKRRSRSSSVGSQNERAADVMMEGVLETIPDKCIFDPAFDAQSESAVASMWKLAQSIATVEWLCTLLTYALRPSQRGQNPDSRILVTAKDTLRRLFAFHRSSLREILKYSADEMSECPEQTLHATSNAGWPAAALALLSKSHPNRAIQSINGPRHPAQFTLRIVHAGGAYVREEPQIDGSRIVMIAPHGAIVHAQSRALNSVSVMRYQTHQGWLSEFKREARKDPIVEVLAMKYDETTDEAANDTTNHVLTCREAFRCLLARIQRPLQQMVVYLSRSVVTMRRNQYQAAPQHAAESLRLSEAAPIIATSLGKVATGYFRDALSICPEDELPLMATGLLDAKGDTQAERHRTRDAEAEVSKGGSPAKHQRGSSRTSQTSDPIGIVPREQQDGATFALYVQSIYSTILGPLLDDRRIKMNTYLLHLFVSHGGLDALLSATLIVGYAALEAVTSAAQQQLSLSAAHLSRFQRCAVKVLPNLMTYLQQLVQSENFLKSPISQAMNQTTEDLISQRPEDTLQKILVAIGTKFLPFIRSEALGLLPERTLQGVLEFTAILTANLRALPARTPQSRARGRGELLQALRTPARTGASGVPAIPHHHFAGLAQAMAAATPVQPPRPAFVPDNDILTQMVDMGFNRDGAHAAMLATSSNNLETVMEYLLTHPSIATENANSETTDPSAVPRSSDAEQDELMRALQMSLQPMVADEVTTAQSDSEVVNADIQPAETASEPQTPVLSPRSRENSDDHKAEDTLMDTKEAEVEVEEEDEGEDEDDNENDSAPSDASESSAGVTAARLLASLGSLYKSTSIQEQKIEDTAANDELDKLGLEYITSALGIAVSVASCIQDHDKLYGQGMRNGVGFVLQRYLIRTFDERKEQFVDLLKELAKVTLAELQIPASNKAFGLLHVALLLSISNADLNASTAGQPFSIFHLCEQEELAVEQLVHSFCSASETTALLWSPLIEPVALFLSHLCGDQLTDLITCDAKAEVPEYLQQAILSNQPRVLVSPPIRRAILAQIVSLLELVGSSTPKVDSNVFPRAEACQAVLELLSKLLIDYTLVQEFQALGGVLALVRLDRTLAFHGIRQLFSLIFRRCVEDPITVRDSIVTSIGALFTPAGVSKPDKSSAEADRIVLPTFLLKTTALFSRHPAVYLEAVARCCDFRTASDGKVHVHYRRDPGLSRSSGIKDATAVHPSWIALAHLAALVTSPHSPSLAIATERPESQAQILTVGEVLHCLADVAVSTPAASDYISMMQPNRDQYTERAAATPSFVGCVLDIMTKRCSIPATASDDDETLSCIADSQGAVRLLTALAAQQSESRRLVLAELVNSLRLHSTEQLDCHAKLMRVKLLCSMLVMLCSINNRPTAQVQRNSHRRVSLDVIRHLFSNGIVDVLADCLAKVDLNHEVAPETVRAILEPLELFSRPSLFHSLKKHKKATQARKLSHIERTQSLGGEHEDTLDEPIGVSHITSFAATGELVNEELSSSSSSSSEEDSDGENDHDPQPGEIIAAHEHGNNEDSESEDEAEDHEDGGDEGDADDNLDAGGEEGVDDEDEDNDDDENGGGGGLRIFGHHAVLNDDWEDVPVLDDQMEHLFRQVGSMDRARMLLQPEDFVTPPNQVRSDPIAALLSSLAGGDQEEIEASVELLNMLPRNMFEMHSNRIRERNGQSFLGIEAQYAPRVRESLHRQNDLLPAGAANVRDIEQPNSHPMLARASHEESHLRMQTWQDELAEIAGEPEGDVEPGYTPHYIPRRYRIPGQAANPRTRRAPPDATMEYLSGTSDLVRNLTSLLQNVITENLAHPVEAVQVREEQKEVEILPSTDAQEADAAESNGLASPLTSENHEVQPSFEELTSATPPEATTPLSAVDTTLSAEASIEASGDEESVASNVSQGEVHAEPPAPEPIVTEAVDVVPTEPSIEAPAEVVGVVDDAALTELVGAEAGLVCPPDYDPEVFAALPDFMQREIVEQYQQTHDQNMEFAVAAGLDLETLAALPDAIRQEVIDQARRDQERQARETPADPSHAAEMDNASFLASLTPDLRAEVLLQSDPAFLASLPPDMIAEAQVLRERVATRWHETPHHNRVVQSLDEEPDANPGDEASSPAAERPVEHPGKMQVEADETDENPLPPRFLPTAISLMYQRRGHWGSQFLERTLLNMAKSPMFRGVLLRILLALLEPAQQHTAKTIFLEAFSTEEVQEPFPPRSLFGPKSPDSLRKVDGELVSAHPGSIPTKAVRVTLNTLSHLVSTSARLKYSTLSSSSDSSMSYFERLVSLLQHERYTSAADMLDDLMRLLDTISTPLDGLQSVTNVSVPPASDPQPADSKDEMVEREEKNEGDATVERQTTDRSWVDIPQPELRDENLRVLCGALLLDACTEESFRRVSRIVSRLSYSPHNVNPITTHLRDVAEGLADSISSKLLEHAKRIAPTPRQGGALRRNLSVQSTAEAKQSDLIVASNPPIEGNLSALPLQSPQFERLHRTLHMLLALSEKADGRVWEALAALNIQDLWDALDVLLDAVQMSSGLADDELQPLASRATQTSSSASAVTSVLIRLLPLIESFCALIGRQATLVREQKVPTPAPVLPEDAPIPFTRADSLPGARFRRVASYRSSVFDGDDGNENEYLARLVSFAQAHHTLINTLIRARPNLLEDSLKALVEIPQCRVQLSFDNKRAYFRSQLRKLKDGRSLRRTLQLSVRRAHIFPDSFHQLRMRSDRELRQRLSVTFHGEEGIDAGGLTREWFSVLSREIFNPDYALFTAANDGATFQPNPLSYVNPDHLDYFRFVGRVLGKAILDEQLMDAHFTVSFYKHLLGLPITHLDMEAVDPEYYKNLTQILEYPLDDLGLDLTFSAEDSRFGKLETVDLIPDGANVRVTDENKLEYVTLVTCHRMTTAIRQQIEAFLEGFHGLVPPELINVFSPAELELLICGLPDVDIEDLRANTEYHQYQPVDEQISWFWDTLRTFSREDRAQFLQFVTGTSKVPLDGFAHLRGVRGPQRFSVHRVYDSHLLPSAHTCFNQLDLPAYESQEELREKLLLAIREGHTGFGFA